MERLSPTTSQAAVHAYIVRVAPEVGGRVIEIPVSDNAPVRAGDLLFQIDPRPSEIAVAAAEAQLDLAGQEIGASTSAVDSAQAVLIQATAQQDNAREQAGRIFQMVERGIYAPARGDQARATLESADAAVAGAAAELERARQQLGPEGADNPQVRQALATLEQARYDLLRTRVVAPSDGVVTNLQLTIGQVVGPGQSAMTFINAGTIWLSAAYKENSLEYMAAGDPAEVVLDSLPGKVFAAQVESIGWGVAEGTVDPATGLPTVRNASGWVREPQRFLVRLTFVGDPPKGVRYGTQATVVVYADENPILHALGRFWIRLVSVLTYVS
nr:HlyD family secretion protein [Paracoccus sp. Z118]